MSSRATITISLQSGRPRELQSITRDVIRQSAKSALVRTYADVESNHTLQMAAALSYYFVMALFPALTSFPPSD